MYNNLNILLINDTELVATLNELGYGQITAIADANAAIHEFVEQFKKQPFHLTFIHDYADGSETELLKALIEIDPDQYIVMLAENLTPENVLNAIKLGANGIICKPITPNKLRMELEKYAFLRENKKSA